MLTTIQGYVDVTVRVPFSALNDIENGQSPDAEAWMHAVNDGSTPDAMEGATMSHADSREHEVVDFEVVEAWTVTPAHDHESRCCREHAVHVDPHRGCILR